MCVLEGDLRVIAFTVPALIFHLWVFPQGLKDGLAIAIAVFLGLIHDNLLAWLGVGVIVFADGSRFPPVWLWCLWALLGISLHHLLKWIYDRLLLAAIAGCVASPLVYAEGMALSNVAWGCLCCKAWQ